MAPNGIDRLNDSNYAEWAMGMEALLTCRGLWEVTSKPADETRPAGSDNMKNVKAWRTKIAEARATIVLNVETSQYPHISSTDANTVWDALKNVHQARGFGTRVAHRRDFWRMAKRADQSMAAWIADVRRAAWNLEAIEATVDEEDIILVLTNGLPPSYAQLIVNLDSTAADDLTLDYVMTRLLNEESRQITAVPGDAPANAQNVAMAAAAEMKPRTPIEFITCFNCRRKGHKERDCPDLQRAAANTAAAPRTVAW